MRIDRWTALAALGLTLTLIASAFDDRFARSEVQQAGDRKDAPAFMLTDSAGKTVNLREYRGKVVLLDFWATWCGGCREEIPWFAKFERTYASKGLAVVGVSLDDEGLKVVKPFLAQARLPYRILLGNDDMARLYGIETMPDSFLIDRNGKIAAVYRGVVDRANIEANIRAMLQK